MSALTLTYNNSPIHIRDEMLCLTDMWKAAGKPAGLAPAEWRRSEDGKRFIEFLAETLNMGISHDGENQRVSLNGVVKVERGGNDPKTWGHWQAGFAYAKRLSPEFHAWCNTAAREKMESIGKVPTSARPQPRARRPAFDVTYRRCMNVLSFRSDIDENQKHLMAARGTKELTGINPLEIMGAYAIAAPDQINYLTPTEIGEKLGLSGRAVNQILLKLDLHAHTPGSATGSDWTMTLKGKDYGRMFDTTRVRAKGSQQQLKWKPEVVEMVRPFAQIPEPVS